MFEELNKKIIFTFDDEAEVWIAKVKGVKALEGIIIDNKRW